MAMNNVPATVAVDGIASRITLLRGQRMIVDADLAALYGVPTKRLNEQVQRNVDRFPADHVPAYPAGVGRGQHRKYLPYAFTEHGAIMAATVLNSPRAVEVSIYVVRAFVHRRSAAGAESA